MSTIATPSLLSVAETARILRISRATAYRLVSTGELPAVRVGGQYRVDQDALNAYLDAGSNRNERTST
jgi:excisionase family DNA binding protein